MRRQSDRSKLTGQIDKAADMGRGGLDMLLYRANWKGDTPYYTMSAALHLQFLDEFANLLSELVHRPLESCQQVERHDDGKADGGYGRKDCLLHGSIRHQAVMSSSSTVRMNAFLSDISCAPLIRKNFVSRTFVAKASTSAFVTSSRGAEITSSDVFPSERLKSRISVFFMMIYLLYAQPTAIKDALSSRTIALMVRSCSRPRRAATS